MSDERVRQLVMDLTIPGRPAPTEEQIRRWAEQGVLR